MALRAVPDGYRDYSRGRIRLVVEDELAEPLCAAGALDGAAVESWGEVVGSRGGGRVPLPVIRIDGYDRPLLVKRLARGGALGPLLGRLASMNRAFAELLVVASLRQAGVRTPPILAVRMERLFGIDRFVRVELVLPLIEPARDLMSFLQQETWRDRRRRALAAAGEAVAAVHRAGVIHEDLNLRNLLVDGNGEVHVIDLGGSRLRSASGSDPALEKKIAANLARLYRSGVKWGLVPSSLSIRDVLRFLTAYRRQDWKQLYRAAAAAYRRTLPLHRISWRLSGARRSRGEGA